MYFFKYYFVCSRQMLKNSVLANFFSKTKV